MEAKMRNGVIIVFFMTCIVSLFASEIDIAQKYIEDNALLADYNILDLNFNGNNTRTFLFYKPYNNRVLNLSSILLSFTDAVIIKTTAQEIVQYLIINSNGLVKTHENITFYDFSRSGIRLNGWILGLGKTTFDDTDMNSFNIQMTDNGIDRVAADPPLPNILWDYGFNYPVKYDFRMPPLPQPVRLIQYEWSENIEIQCARTGLRDDNLLEYIKGLSNYEKRLIINAMFALYGYEFKTNEWKNYFSRFLWYKPDSSVLNSIDILDEYQKKLYEYLVK
jgi:hypothetical protein